MGTEFFIVIGMLPVELLACQVSTGFFLLQIDQDSSI